MRHVLLLVFCVLFAVPAQAQQSEQRQAMERKAGFCFWTGISVAAAGVLPLMAGAKSVGLPMVAGGGALTYYGLRLHNKAKRMPSTTFGVMPLKKGLAFGVSRSW